MTFDFDAETALVQIDEHRWRTNLSDAWSIAGNPNGGYLLAPLQRAMLAASGQPDPLSVTTHYLRPGQPGPADIEVEVVRTGRTVSTVRGRLIQQDRVRLETIGAFSDLANAAPSGEIAIPPPDMPPPERCVPRNEIDQGITVAIMNRIEIRVRPDQVTESNEPVLHGWIRFADERPIDAHVLTLFADAFPPPLFALLGQVGWVPTIELTVHVRRRPAQGWILGQFRTTDLAGPRCIEDGWLWDSTGALVAVSRQVGLVLSNS